MTKEAMTRPRALDPHPCQWHLDRRRVARRDREPSPPGGPLRDDRTSTRLLTALLAVGYGALVAWFALLFLT